MTSIVCTLERIGCPCDTEDFLDVICPDCRGHVAIHQPDERQPDRLLGTCQSCSAWFLIAPKAATMLRLPDEAELESALTTPTEP